MTLDQLRYFVCVAREGHMGKASRLLHVTASTLSQAIRGLEEGLGLELFKRDGRKLLLTDAGKRLAAEGAAILSNIDSLASRLSARQATTLVSCGGPPSLVSGLLIPGMRSLESVLHQFDFRFQYIPSSEVGRHVIERKLDLGIRFTESRSLDMDEVEIGRDRLYACARHAHPLFARPASERLKELQNYPLIAPQPMQILTSAASPVLSKIIANLCRLQFVIPSYEDGTRILAESDHWGLFPGWFVRTHADRLGKLTDADLCPDVMICALIPKKSPLWEFREVIVSTLRGMTGG